jgi:outer membrane receptor protein involved in Fe transport
LPVPLWVPEARIETGGKAMKRQLLALTGLGILLAAPLVALETPEATAQAATQTAAQTATPTAPTAAQAEQAKKEKEGLHRAEEITVESASKVESKLIDAPATMSVVTAETLASQPAQNMADTLRSLPGVNVIQMSARDINLTTRQATSTLATSQLVSVDGRSVYLDFFGLVLWDFVPSPTSGEIKQIEVVRGPASVVWGANAVNGVVNVITKTPREREGFGITLTGGVFNRDAGSRADEGAGGQYGGSFSYAKAVNDTWSYRLNAGYFNSDPLSRPTGSVPLECHPLAVVPCRSASGAAVTGGVPIGGAPFPADASGPGSFENSGTSQPKFDLRVDQDFKNGGRLIYQGGYSGTEGMVHTGIGPFDLQNGSYMAYGRLAYSKGALRISAFGNFVDAEAPNLLAFDPDTLGQVVLKFKTETYDFEVGNSNVLGGKHILTYGGNVRRNNFDISLAQGPDRTEYGAYGQWEYFVSKFRVAAGARVDKFGNITDPVFSPRVSVMYKPTPEQSIRVSYNRAFVSPSFINNYLNQNISNTDPVINLQPLTPLLPPPLRPLVPPPFLLTINAYGNPDLKAQVTDGYEVAYTGTFKGKTMVGLSVYRTDTKDNINFVTLIPVGTPGYPLPTFYGVTNPARGITLTQPPQAVAVSPILMGILATIPPQFGGPILLPEKAATYLNLGPIRNQGIEASIDHRFNAAWSVFGNYSWQDTPKVLPADVGQIPYPAREVGIPSEHRFNAGLGYTGDKFFGNVGVNYASKALWVDVLGDTYHGYTKAYTMLNAAVGVKLAEGKVILSLKGVNLANQAIQQHVFGDILNRSVVAEARFFAK